MANGSIKKALSLVPKRLTQLLDDLSTGKVNKPTTIFMVVILPSGLWLVAIPLEIAVVVDLIDNWAP